MVIAVQRRNFALAGEGAVLRIGAGIASGRVIAGNIGSLARMEYTVIGDAVHLRARLEHLNRAPRTSIRLAGESRTALAPCGPAPAHSSTRHEAHLNPGFSEVVRRGGSGDAATHDDHFGLLRHAVRLPRRPGLIKGVVGLSRLRIRQVLLHDGSLSGILGCCLNCRSERPKSVGSRWRHL